MLALSHRYWPCPIDTGSILWELPCLKATGALTKALAAECLESLKKVRIPPSSTVQEELQFFLGRRAGVTHSCGIAQLLPPAGLLLSVAGDTGVFLPEPLPSVQCLGPVEHPGFFEAFKLESQGGDVKFAPCSPWCWCEVRLGAPPWCSPSPPYCPVLVTQSRARQRARCPGWSCCWPAHDGCPMAPGQGGVR